MVMVMYASDTKSPQFIQKVSRVWGNPKRQSNPTRQARLPLFYFAPVGQRVKGCHGFCEYSSNILHYSFCADC